MKTWEDLSDLDKGAVLLHLSKVDIDGESYATQNYPCQYFDDPELTAMTPRQASEHAQSLGYVWDICNQDEFERLYDLALDEEARRRR